MPYSMKNLVSTSVALSNVTISSIPQTGRHLLLHVAGFTSSGGQSLTLTVNNINTSSYRHGDMRYASNSGLSQELQLRGSFDCGNMYAGGKYGLKILFPFYSVNGISKSALGEYADLTGTSVSIAKQLNVAMDSITSPISSIQLFSSTLPSFQVSLEVI